MRLRQRIVTAVATGLIGAAVWGSGLPVAATTVGTTQGCTPGYWKNHTAVWQEFRPTDLVGASFIYPSAGAPFASWTLLQALQGGGGTDVAGAKQILLRAATAALLNAAYDPLLFPWQRNDSLFRPPLLATVNAALASNDRARILALASWLDRDNNLGCPL